MNTPSLYLRTNAIVVASLLLFACRGSANNAPPTKSANKPPTPPAGMIRLDVLTGVRDAEEKRHDEIRKILEQKVSGDFTKLTIDQAMSRLSNKGQLFAVDYEQENYKSYQLRDGMKFNSVTRREVLRKILRTRDASLEYSLENGALKLAHGFDDAPQLFTRSYSLADLAFPKASRRARRVPGFGQAIGAPAIRNSRETSDYDWLEAEIKNATTGPWRSDEGVGGTMVIVNNIARIRQNEKNHAEIRALLAAVRAAASGRLKGNMLYLREAGYPVTADTKIIKLWSRPISIKFANLSLKEAVAKFSSETGIPMRLAKDDLENEGVNLDARITFSARNAVVYSALRRMLSRFEPRVNFVLERGELVILPQSGAEERLESAVYDVRDIATNQRSANQLMRTLKLETSDPWQPEEGIGGTMSMLDEAGSLIIRQTQRGQIEIAAFLQHVRRKTKNNKAGLIDSRPKNPDAVTTRIYIADDAAQAKELVKVIPVFVLKQTWNDRKSSPAIHAVDNKLIVRQTAKVHTAIRTFLADLDAADQTDRLGP